MNVRLSANAVPAAALKELLQRHLAIGERIEFQLEPSPVPFRTPDATVLVAIVTGAAGALGMLITGLCAVARELSSQKIVVQARDGRRLEFPADLSSERLNEVVKQL